MLRFSANLGFLWPDRPLVDRIDAAAAAGFRAIDLHWSYDVPAKRMRARSTGWRCSASTRVRGDVDAGQNGLAGREDEFHVATPRRGSGATRRGDRREGAGRDRARAAAARLLAPAGGRRRDRWRCQAGARGAILADRPGDPGVPWTRPLDGPAMGLALKSGNFGTPDFFPKAWALLT